MPFLSLSDATFILNWACQILATNEMGGKRSKKKNRQQKRRGQQPGLKEVLERYQASDFPGTLNLFRKARFRSEEAGPAKQLKAALMNQMALQHFRDQEYRQVINLLTPTLQVQSKPGFPLPASETHLLMGLSHLYLGQFDQAVDSLAQANDPPSGIPSFYLLLARAYAASKKPDTLADFEQTHQNLLALLDDNQLAYLRSTFYLAREDFAKAASFLKKVKATKNNGLEPNTQNLQALLEEQPPQEEALESSKTLYKVLASGSLTTQDVEYLDHFEEFEELLLESKNYDRAKTLGQHLDQLCAKGEPLTDDLFQHCFDNIREDLKPFLVYNQVATLYNQADNEGYTRRILRYLRKHRDLFFQIPESGDLYLDFAVVNIESIRPDSFIRSFRQFINRFGKVLTVKRLDQMSWKIQHTYLGEGFKDKLDFLVELLDEFPSMVGLKVQLYLVSVLDFDPSYSTKMEDLFALDNFPDNRERILNEVGAAIEGMEPELIFFLQSSMEEVLEFYFSSIERFLRITTDMVNRHPPKAAAAPVVVAITKKVHRSFLKVAERHGELLQSDTIPEMTNQFYSLLDTIGTDESAHFKKELIEATKTIGQSRELMELLESNNPEPKATDLFGKYINQDRLPELMDQLIDLIDKQHYAEELVPILTLFLKTVVEKVPGKAIDILAEFDERLEIIADQESCDHPVQFYCAWLKDLFKIKKTDYHQAVYTLFDSAPWALTSGVMPVQYNTVAKGLDFAGRAAKASSDFEYDKIVVNDYLQYLEELLQVKSLKTIERSYKLARAYFTSDNR